MAVHKTGAGPVEGSATTSLAAEAHALVNDVGPGWGLVIIVAILLLLPKYGLLFHLSQLFKEDRADKRKHQLEHDKLVARYNKRPDAVVKRGGQK